MESAHAEVHTLIPKKQIITKLLRIFCNFLPKPEVAAQHAANTLALKAKHTAVAIGPEYTFDIKAIKNKIPKIFIFKRKNFSDFTERALKNY